MRVLKCARGQVFYADLSPVIGSEQGGHRPVIVIQNDIGNIHSPTTIVAPITSKMTKKPLPTHVDIPLFQDSVILCEQLRTIDKARLKSLIAEADKQTMAAVDKAIKISLGV
jgi:mRNA interferase MazF